MSEMDIKLLEIVGDDLSFLFKQWNNQDIDDASLHN